MGLGSRPNSRPPVRAVELSPDDAFRFDRLADTLLHEALFEFDHFVSVDRRRVDAGRWKEYRQDDDVTIYRERDAGSADASSLLVTSNDRATTTRFTAFAPAQSQYAAPVKAKTTPRLLATGTIATTLDDVLYGVVAPTGSAMRLQASSVHNDEFADGAVLATLRAPTPSDPFQFLGIKWLLQRGMGGGLVRPRDFVYLEAAGVHIKQDGSGRRVGFHLMHSVDLPQCASRSRSIQRGAFSTCYLYHELADGRGVDVYLTALVQPRGNLIAPLAMRAAAAMLRSNWQSLALCAEAKKLAWLLQTHRQLMHATPAASSRCGLCSKSLRGFGKKKLHCQLCAMTVCTHCSTPRTLHSQGFAHDSVVSSAMLFCKKCLALASEESATEIASQQLWEDEVVRTGRAHTQTALALARRETNASRLHSYAQMEAARGSVPHHQQRRESGAHRATWHETDPTRRYHLLDKPHSNTVSSAMRRGTNGTWNGSARATETLSLGAMEYRNSSLPRGSHGLEGDDPLDLQNRERRASTASSALVLLDDRRSTRRMKALDYLPHGGELSTTTASSSSMASSFQVRRRASDHERISMASSSMNTEAEYEVESVYSRASMASSIALLEPGLDQSRAETNMDNSFAHTQTIDEEDELAAAKYYTEPPRSSSTRSRASSARVQFQDPPRQSIHQFQEPHRQSSHHHQQQYHHPRLSETLRRSSAGHGDAPPSEQRLSYQMQLWMQMNELRDTAESTYQVTKKNAEAMSSMRFFSQQPLRSAAPSSSLRPPPVKTAMIGGPAPLPVQSPISYARRRFSGADSPSATSSLIPLQF